MIPEIWTTHQRHDAYHKTTPAVSHTITQARVDALIWSHPGDQITLVGPDRTPTVHWCVAQQCTHQEHRQLLNFTSWRSTCSDTTTNHNMCDGRPTQELAGRDPRTDQDHDSCTTMTTSTTNAMPVVAVARIRIARGAKSSDINPAVTGTLVLETPEYAAEGAHPASGWRTVQS